MPSFLEAGTVNSSAKVFLGNTNQDRTKMVLNQRIYDLSRGLSPHHTNGILARHEDRRIHLVERNWYHCLCQ